jgi:hypothetical protein
VLGVEQSGRSCSNVRGRPWGPNVTVEKNKNNNSIIILWHVDPLLGNDSEIIGYTTAVAK